MGINQEKSGEVYPESTDISRVVPSFMNQGVQTVTLGALKWSLSFSFMHSNGVEGGLWLFMNNADRMFQHGFVSILAAIPCFITPITPNLP